MSQWIGLKENLLKENRFFDLPIIQCWEHHPNISKHDPPQKKW
jgi:hypothetical protein